MSQKPPAKKPNPTKQRPLTPKQIKDLKEMAERLQKQEDKFTSITRSKEWKRSSFTPQALAAKVSKSMAALRNTDGQVYIRLYTPMGNGTINHTFKIQDPTHYFFDFAVLEAMPKEVRMVANGKYRMIRADNKWLPPVGVNGALPGALVSPSTLVERWNTDFPRLVFQGFTERKDAWVQIVNQWVHGAEGYKTTSEEQHLLKNGHDYLTYRIIAERDAAAAKKFGQSAIEVVIDGYHLLPVTIKIVRKDQQGKQWKTTWTCDYKFKKKFTQADFKAPFPK